MRGLAAYAMGGRARAMIIAIASSSSLLFAWVGAALVALVTLRKGVAEGAKLLLWASLPAIVLARVTGDSTVVTLILGTGILALVLRLTTSLALAALGSAAVALLTGVAMATVGDAMIDELVRVFGEFAATLEARGEEATLQLRPPTELLLAGMLGTANGVLSFLCLALGRYWQAALYNPGGFGEEFRALRFPPALVLGLGAAAAALIAAGLEWRSWAAMALLPLSISGFALLHARANYRKQGGFWLGAIYLAWLAFDEAKLALLGLVLADAMMDFRSRWDDDDDSGSRRHKRDTESLAGRDVSGEGKDEELRDDVNDEERDDGPTDGRDDSDPRP
ncbi:MAG: hypothetical protein AAGL66_13820 [Pseudomonadota bacterium]